MPLKKPGMDVGMGGEQDNFSRRERVFPLWRLLLVYFSDSTICLMYKEKGEPTRMRRPPSASYFRRPCGSYPRAFGLAAEAAAEPIAVAIAAAAQEQDKPQAAVAAAASAAVIAAEEAIAASAAAAQQDNQPENRGASPIVVVFTSTSTVCSS